MRQTNNSEKENMIIYVGSNALRKQGPVKMYECCNAPTMSYLCSNAPSDYFPFSPNPPCFDEETTIVRTVLVFALNSTRNASAETVLCACIIVICAFNKGLLFFLQIEH